MVDGATDKGLGKSPPSAASTSSAARAVLTAVKSTARHVTAAASGHAAARRKRFSSECSPLAPVAYQGMSARDAALYANKHLQQDLDYPPICTPPPVDVNSTSPVKGNAGPPAFVPASASTRRGSAVLVVFAQSQAAAHAHADGTQPSLNAGLATAAAAATVLSATSSSAATPTSQAPLFVDTQLANCSSSSSNSNNNNNNHSSNGSDAVAASTPHSSGGGSSFLHRLYARSRAASFATPSSSAEKNAPDLAAYSPKSAAASALSQSQSGHSNIGTPLSTISSALLHSASSSSGPSTSGTSTPTTTAAAAGGNLNRYARPALMAQRSLDSAAPEQSHHHHQQCFHTALLIRQPSTPAARKQERHHNTLMAQLSIDDEDEEEEREKEDSASRDQREEMPRVVFENQDAVYSLFLHAHRCYDLIPVSTKLVVLDTRLSMAKAFTALTVNGLRAAPLWHAETSRFVGMLTITDFIHILHAFHFEDNNTAVTEEGVQQQEQQPQQQVPAGCSGELESTQLEAWRLRFAAQNRWRPLVSINPNDSVARAVEVLCREKVHRLPILDPATGNISYILTHKRIIKFLALYMHDLPRPDCMARTPKELGIGSWSNVLSVHMDTRLQDALATFLKNRVSALPVVDDENRVVDIYAKYDVMHLAHEKAYHNLETTVFEALKHRSQYFDGVQCCRETDSLQTVVEQLVRVDVHRLIVVDADRRVTGIVSLSDILRFLVLDQPCSAVNSASVSTVMMEGGGASGKEDTNNSPYGGSSQPAPVRASASSGSGAGTSTSSPPSAGALLHPPLAEEREEDEQLEEEVDDEAMAAALKQQQQQSQTVLAT